MTSHSAGGRGGLSNVGVVSEAADHSEPPPHPDPRQPPARPALTSNLGSPLEVLHQPPPGVLKVSFWLWVLSCAAGVTVMVHFGVRSGDIHAALMETVRRDEPSRSNLEVANLADTTVILATCLLVVPIVLKLVLAVLMRARRGWARTLLAIISVLALPLTAAAVTLLDTDSLDPPLWVLVAVALQELLVLTALVTMLLPACTRWFRLRPM